MTTKTNKLKTYLILFRMTVTSARKPPFTVTSSEFNLKLLKQKKVQIQQAGISFPEGGNQYWQSLLDVR